ncbi:Phototropin-1A [Fulvia fulva]|uniref:Phototropin-1A n=1 Tax=Passalora fulva TaxID=5499 RepID=A0A9Q8L8R0_PASFU|nr:Phototropin-1A [Fulvia fulva]KAK4635153.1 Phototropin-1A [Fulvia fulva]KAK4638355.1 Phototropin-1A [Fulvia fulva]UJO12980.1 Phototropin-1A [Fulvia fulva]WPV09899.1 Phototropin-1A [Fulvia fulva]WPV24330.1 Phototropin-1A [Fulvia fulva]
MSISATALPPMRVMGKELRLKAFSSAYEYGRQYPHQSANGRRELRAMDKENATSSPRASQNSAPGSRDQSHNRSKVNSVYTAIHVPTTPSRDAMNEYESEDFQRKYNARPDTEVPPDTPDFSGMDDGTGQPVVGPGTPGEYSKRGIHIPTRTSSTGGKQRLAPQQTHDPMPPSRSKSPIPRDSHQSDTPPSPETADEYNYEPGARSSAGSVFSQETSATSIHTLPPLQTKGPDNSDAQYLEPVLEDDPRSWDLVGPASDDHATGMYALEQRSEQLFSAEHLRTIFEDPKLLLKFTGFLNSHRPKSIPILIYYLDALKALRAINYANAIAEALEPIKGQGFTDEVAKPTNNNVLEEKANRAFDVLVQEDLPAYVAHIWIQVVSVSIQRRITGTLAPHLREASEGLAEVFCLTDPSRTDNPIVFASEEFTRTTQYGMNYIIGRNCRFLQGPRSSPHSVRRLAIACTQGKEHTEVFVNYRRDGSPFMNLLMTAPLMDSRGNIRYFIGAQVDVSGLIKDCSEMEGLIRLLEKEQEAQDQTEEEADASHKDEFQELSEMFNGAELDTVRKYGGRMHKEYVDDSDRESLHSGRPRLLLKDPTQDIMDKTHRSLSDAASGVQEKINGKLEGVYQHYLLIRPAPSLRILFTSPSLRVPGILQSPFLNRIGGSSRVRADLGAALAEGRGVTAKIRWLTRPDEDGEGEGRPRWIHCTPLLGHSGAVGVWMIVLVDEEGSLPGTSSGRRFRQAPPVSNNIGGKEWDASHSRERKKLNAYDAQSERGGSKNAEYFHRPVSRGAHSAVGSSMPARSPGPHRQTSHVTSANASEFSFNLKG